MIDKQTRTILNEHGNKLAEHLPGFYGKVTFNFQDGVYVNLNVEQTIKNNNLKIRSKV